LLSDNKVGFEHEGNQEPFHAGRLTLVDGKLTVMGVLPDTERDVILEKTAPKQFQKFVDELAKLSEKIGPGTDKVVQRAKELPEGFDMAYSGLKSSVISFDKKTQTFTVYQTMKTREKKGLLVAGSDPKFRKVLGKLFVDSSESQVSPWWLFWSYILATLGELCLSPVGLSMVSKLAPARYATMLMGVWMLTSAFGNFVAGASGEYWGKVTPFDFFLWLTVIVAVSAVVLLALVRFVSSTMHGVK
jgi:POT family proton-dependent oligopeptide transporter